MPNDMKNSSQLSIKMRFAIILGTLVIGFSLFGFATFKAMNTLNVNGPVYQRIVQGKDIIADVLPPPEYIIESYLVALQLTQAADAAEISTLITRFQTLKTEYESRHNYWLDQALEQELQTPLLEHSYRAAQTFYKEAEQSFLPSIQSAEHNDSQISLQKMRRAYEEPGSFKVAVNLSGSSNSLSHLPPAKKETTLARIGAVKNSSVTPNPQLQPVNNDDWEEF